MNYSVKTVVRDKPEASLNILTDEKKVLIVDDTDYFIEVEKSILSPLANCTVLTAHSGVEALQVIEHEHPHLVYLDLHMGNMDGDVCCKEVKKIYGDSLPVVMVIQDSSLNDFERCWKSGCDSVIVKPINHHLFVSTAQKFLHKALNGNRVSSSNARQEVRIKVLFGHGMSEVLADYSINMSNGGMFLATEHLMPVDTVLSIEFSLPNLARPICCSAKVAWVNGPQQLNKPDMPSGMGLMFQGLSLTDVHAIRGYLNNSVAQAVWS